MKNWKSYIPLGILLLGLLVLIGFMVRGVLIKKQERKTAEAESISQELETASETAETTTAPASESALESESSVEETESTAAYEGASYGGYDNLFIVRDTDRLNIRKEPSTDAEVVGYMERYAGGSVLSETDDHEWYEVKSGEVTGYIASSYVAVGTEALALARANSTYVVEVTSDSVNIRTEAKKDADITATAEKGQQFPYLSEEESFYRIRVSDREAYISKSVSELVAGTPVASPYSEETEPASSDAGTDETEPGETTAPASVTTGANGITVCIDAGHQAHGISDMEPNGPGSSVMKAKLTTGTSGCATGRAEHVVNLEVALKLQAELQGRGYNVVMIRTTADCPMSNAERAQVANSSGANCFIRIHCNSSSNPAVQGIMCYAPSPANPYISADIVNASNTFSSCVLNSMCQSTGWQNRGLLQDDGMTGINWCTVPVTIVEMGFMSNAADDQMLSDPSWQNLLSVGMANGIDAYFGR